MKTIIITAAFLLACVGFVSAQTIHARTPQHKSKIGKKKNQKLKVALAKRQAAVHK